MIWNDMMVPKDTITAAPSIPKWSRKAESALESKKDRKYAEELKYFSNLTRCGDPYNSSF